MGASILITRGRDERLRAFHNVCPHRGTRLVWEEDGTRSKFSCRYHMWTFDREGALMSAPDLENFYDLEKSNCGLSPVALASCAGFIFINLDPEPKISLREFLGPLAEKLEGLEISQSADFYEYTYEVDANWKTAFDNFQELYHARFIHAKTLGGRVTGPDNPFGYPTGYDFVGPHRTMQLWFNQDFRAETVEGLVGGMANGAPSSHLVTANEYICIFPNMFMLPRKLGGFTQTIIPIGPAKSRAIIRVYANGPNDKASIVFAREFVFSALLDVHSEDRDLIEASQFGLQSGALTHIHFQSQEAACRHLFNTVDHMVRRPAADQPSET
jgi:phenylpropionate dioxygenase-like ring-hydroxylating dioxygenase large terminal subunit